jgi:hypothetical protein
VAHTSSTAQLRASIDLDHPPKSVVEVQTMIQTAREHTKKWRCHTRDRRAMALSPAPPISTEPVRATWPAEGERNR